MPEGTLSGAVSSIDDLARFLSTSLQDAVDETGLTGAYTVETTFDKGTLMRFPANLPARFAALTDVSRYASLPPFITAFKDDLGLIVERAQRPVPIVVITHVGPLKEN